MSRWFVRGLTAWSLHASASSISEVPDLLTGDSECLAGDGESCTLNALQLTARARGARAEGPTAAAWSQCGGKKWTGATECADGNECFKVDDWYSQCRPKATTGVPAPAPATQSAPAPEVKKVPDTPDTPDTPEPAAMALPKRPPQPTPKTFTTVNPIISRGNFLYDSVTGKRFFAKGVAYNPRNEHYQHNFGPSVQLPGWVDKCVPGKPEGGYRGYSADVQTDALEEYWSADLEAMANMGANTVRLYNIDPRESHDKFMKKAESLGLYVIVPLTGKDWGFLPAFPAPDCYTQEIEGYGNVGTNLLAFAKTVMKEFAPYNNTLMFTAANELAQLDKNGYAAFPCVKAFVRDLHNYQAECNSTMRRVPLIYSDVDTGGGAARKVVADYLTCALESDADAVDAYGLNVYSWCDETYPGDGKADNFQYSPYKDIKQVILIFNEAIPHACPAHHVSCGELEWTSNPHFRTLVLLFFLSFTIALSATFAACQSNCVCLSAFLEEDGIWLRWKKHMVTFLRRCRQAPSECSRRLYCCCRRSRLRVQPQESRTSLEARGFGASEDFKDLMIIPVPAPLPQKPSIPGFPRRWCHTALPKFHEVVELSTEGEGADVARLILSDPTWHCPPRCERVFRIESSDTWKTYVQMRTAELRKAQHGVPTVKKEEVLGEELEERVNEKILFYGTTVDMAMCVKVDAQVPDTPDCPRHVLLRRLGGGAQFCDRGFLAHEQATEAGYNKENLDSPWAVLVCRVVLGRSLVHNGQHGGPRLQREWGSGRYGSIMIQRDGHREFLLPPDVRHAAYPEYVVILR